MLKGDANLDGKVDLKDASFIAKAMVEIVIPNALQMKSGDANGDGIFSLKDATRLAQYTVESYEITWNTMGD